MCEQSAEMSHLPLKKASEQGVKPLSSVPTQGEECGYWTVNDTMKGVHPMLIWGEHNSSACVSELQPANGDHRTLGMLWGMPFSLTPSLIVNSHAT